MKKNKNKDKKEGSALTKISELHYLYVCAVILEKAVLTIAPHRCNDGTQCQSKRT